ncbi:MAG: alpha/beta fold hydrolase [Gallionellaceae bacterium]
MPKNTQSVPARLSSHHRPSVVNQHCIDAKTSFSEYISCARSVISQARQGLDPIELKKVVEGNAPFELKPIEGYAVGKQAPHQRGILLVHGLTDSPYFMRHLAAFFQQQGFRVMAILLPGHGTQPGDLLNVRWQEWAKTVAYGVEQLALEVDEIYLGGYSAGGALSVYHSLQDERIRGLFLFAPALKISPKAAFAHSHKFLSWLIPSAKWLSICPDQDRYKYESFPKNAAAQMYALTQATKNKLAGRVIHIPVFMVMSQDDVTVDTGEIINFLERCVHPISHSVYYYSDSKKIPVWKLKNSPECVDGVLLDRKILGPAHTAIVMPSEDTYYGEHGEYCNCIHYIPNELEKYASCQQQSTQLFQGELTPENLQTGTLKRLTHNPNFAGLKKSMGRFIELLPAYG